MVYDHHTHTKYSHGTGTILDNVKVAHEKGIKSIAITDHGPGNFSYGINLTKLDEMREDIRKAKEMFPDVEVLLGVEANTKRVEPYIDVDAETAKSFDLLICGYHFAVKDAGMIQNKAYRFGFWSEKNLIMKNTEMITNALLYNEEHGNHIVSLTHPGDKGPFDIWEISRVCEETGTYMEINDKHKHLTTDEIRLASRRDIKFIIGSDAHVPSKVGTFEEPLRHALEAGLDPERIVNICRL